MLCRPVESKRVLFKPANLRTPATRFDIDAATKTKITQPDDPLFNFGSEILASDYDDGIYELFLGRDGVGVELDKNASSSSELVLKRPFHGDEISNVSLSRGRRRLSAGSNKVLVHLNGDQKRGLLVDQLAIGATSTAVFGRVIADGGLGSSRVQALTSSISGINNIQTLTLKEPVVVGDETDMSVEIQGQDILIQGKITSSDRFFNTITCDILPKTDKVTVTSSAPTTIKGPTGSRFLSEFRTGDTVYVSGVGTTVIQTLVSDQEMTVDASMLPVIGADIYVIAPQGTKARKVTIKRTPREDDLSFTSIVNVDDDVYELRLSGLTSFAHGPQSLEMKPGVRVVSGATTKYLARFTSSSESMTSRFDNRTIPPETDVIRAVLESPQFKVVSDPLVLASTSLWINDQERALTSVSEANDIYTFTLASRTSVPVPVKEIVYVKGPELADIFSSNLPTGTWSTPFDEFFSIIGNEIENLGKKACLLLQGRPVELGITAGLISAASAAFSVSLLPIRGALTLALAGLSNSQVIEDVLVSFVEAGMDQAADALVRGAVSELASMTSATATSEGLARKRVDELGHRMVGTVYNKETSDIASSLTAQEQDKTILAGAKNSYEKNMTDHINKKRQVMQALKEKIETIIDNTVAG